MSHTIIKEGLDGLASYLADQAHSLRWSSIFVLPAWLKVWWQVFGSEPQLYLRIVRTRDKIIGVAPLMVKDKRASFIGSTDVCDYLDFTVVPGMEGDFCNALLDDLIENNVNYLDLRPLRPDSTALTNFVSAARNRGYKVLQQPEDVSFELELPSSWEEYLAKLSTKQRHEVRRKLRRLSQAGEVDYHFVKNSAAVNNAMNMFLKMFSESRQDKAAFLTTQRESFLRSLASTLSEGGLLGLGILELDRVPTAMTMCFDYNDCIYLYNSAYDPSYRTLGVGLLCKILCIKNSIEKGRKKFDFLKGGESYKYHLGGRKIPLYSCQITIE